MDIKWVGHSCFLIEANKVKLMTDPYDPSVNYRPPEFEVDIVLVSHQHFDHNYVEAVKGSPVVVDEEGKHKEKGVPITGIKTYHDQSKGQKRGENLLFKFSLDEITLAHFGDLGHKLNQEQLSALEEVEAVFIPVGGYYTIGPQEAAQIINDLPNLKVVFPMHYKTDRLSADKFPLAEVDEFVKELPEAKEIQLESPTCQLTPDKLPQNKEIWILNPL